MNNKKEKIIKSAKKLFEKFGYKKTSIDQIVEKAGIAKGTFYLYFKDKDDLYSQIVFSIIKKGEDSLNKLKISLLKNSEKFYLKLVRSIFFLEENKLIHKIARKDPLYFSETVSRKAMHQKHKKLIQIMLGIPNKNSDLTDFELEKLAWFFTFLLETEDSFEDKKAFLSFTKKLAATLIKGIFGEKDFDYQKLDKFLDLKN